MNATTWTAKIIQCDVHDGDTLTNVHLDVGWGVILTRCGTALLSIRLTSSLGPVNTPEVFGKETQAGLIVCEWLQRAIKQAGTEIWLKSRSIDHDAYGRCIGEIHFADFELGKELIRLGYAKYCGPGGKRIPFTDEELTKIISP